MGDDRCGGFGFGSQWIWWIVIIIIIICIVPTFVGGFGNNCC